MLWLRPEVEFRPLTSSPIRMRDVSLEMDAHGNYVEPDVCNEGRYFTIGLLGRRNHHGGILCIEVTIKGH